tara:strand:+ start:110 stop:556 length:447 start_codon:yes stop_codon:yes gene_type:complete
MKFDSDYKTIVLPLIFYSLVIIDYLPSIDTSVVFSRPVRLIILLFMLLSSMFNISIALFIGFAYIMTVFRMSFNTKKIKEDPMRKANTYTEPYTEQDFSNTINLGDRTLTTNVNLNDAQNNVVDETAMNSEIKTWEDGYGTQGLSMKL